MIDRAPLWLLSLAQMTGALVTFLLFLTTAATMTTIVTTLFTFGVMAVRTLRFTPAEGGSRQLPFPTSNRGAEVPRVGRPVHPRRKGPVW